MRSIARVSLVIAASAALVGSLALPASAADTATTIATVEVPAGSLAITAPATAGLTALTPGGTASATLTGVQVIDTRAGTLNWSAQVVLTNFVGGTPTNIIPATAATYTPAAAVPVVGTVTVTPTTQIGLATAKVVQEGSDVVGNNTATWNAVLSVTAPTDALADTYTATLTHSFL